jgi:hypothetical protein
MKFFDCAMCMCILPQFFLFYMYSAYLCYLPPFFHSTVVKNAYPANEVYGWDEDCTEQKQKESKQVNVCLFSKLHHANIYFLPVTLITRVHNMCLFQCRTLPKI